MKKNVNQFFTLVAISAAALVSGCASSPSYYAQQPYPQQAYNQGYGYNNNSGGYGNYGYNNGGYYPQPQYPQPQYPQYQAGPVYNGDCTNSSIVGAIAGGLLMNRVGKGNGNTAATAAGAVVGSQVGRNLGCR